MLAFGGRLRRTEEEKGRRLKEKKRGMPEGIENGAHVSIIRITNGHNRP